MNDNARPHRALLVYEFLESKDIRHRDWPPDLNPIEHLGHSGDDNCYTQRPSENHPENENSVAERVGRISTRTGKLPHFKNDITLRGLYSYNLMALHLKYDFWHMTATAGSDVVQSGRPIFDDFFQHLWPYIGNNTANVVFQMVKRLWLIRIDQ
ncbi:hypothetical protein TNCV_4778891 [Trichonephila clavipes]|nr:hypothetical protein TNCV_4778891 [Trichonephila clavipes]